MIIIVIACGAPSRSVRIATTTSIDNAGLLPLLTARFEGETGIRVEPFIVGSGRAFAMARSGEVGLVITHEPRGEAELRREGVALRQRRILANPFVLAGPPENPAGVTAGDSVVDAFRRIHASGARFASRGDGSGTHVRELDLWRAAGVDPATNRGYERLGQGMSALLRSASELRAYVLTDLATFERMRERVRLVPLVTEGEGLENVYVVTLVRGVDGSAPPEAAILYDWLGSAAAGRVVSEFRSGGGRGFAWVSDPD